MKKLIYAVVLALCAAMLTACAATAFSQNDSLLENGDSYSIGENTNALSDDISELSFKSFTCDIMGGNVKVSLQRVTEKSIQLLIENNLSEVVQAYGMPVVADKTGNMAVDWVSNPAAGGFKVSPDGEYTVEYIVPERFTKNGCVISGKLWVENPEYQDRTYTIILRE